ncbi:hypothetical protein [Actinomadura sp. 9N215]|uniref:hypothetical protein n=1 Tax=Actinomadura sp. 9N215 TaxID=3375150 RepID=UPI00379B42D2
MCAQTGEGRRDRRGVFVPAEVLVASGSVASGVVLAALYPAFGLPIGVGAAVIGLLYGIYHNTRQRSAPPPDPGTPPAVPPGDAP